MDHLRLQPHVSYAMVGATAVFLDCRRDRYLALDGSAARAFGLARDNPSAMDDASRNVLLSTGLFASAPSPGILSPVSCPMPEFGIIQGCGRQSPPGDVLEALLLVRSARKALRKRPLHVILDRAPREGLEHSTIRPAETTARLAARFRQARAWVPIAPSCFQDSLALRRWLERRQAAATLVLGVKLDPFAAHCWVQLGQTVLNDAPDRVASFTPILAVE